MVFQITSLVDNHICLKTSILNKTHQLVIHCIPLLLVSLLPIPHNFFFYHGGSTEIIHLGILAPHEHFSSTAELPVLNSKLIGADRIFALRIAPQF